MIRKQKEEDKKQKDDIDKLQKLLNIDFEQALAIYNQTRTKDTAALKRPDLYFANKKRDLDAHIKEILVPQLITRYNIKQADKQPARMSTIWWKIRMDKEQGIK